VLRGFSLEAPVICTKKIPLVFVIFPPFSRFGFSESGVRRVAVWSFCVCFQRAVVALALLLLFVAVFLFSLTSYE
jgi:hypothetical protein